ncbi:MAG: class I SAM-dependent methyltransferase [Candidatus Diapherotrites archaeon]|nr:class I SAM-dependent methyltransferase [Candidatus Diapherotrites archaeon]
MLKKGEINPPAKDFKKIDGQYFGLFNGVHAVASFIAEMKKDELRTDFAKAFAQYYFLNIGKKRSAPDDAGMYIPTGLSPTPFSLPADRKPRVFMEIGPGIAGMELLRNWKARAPHKLVLVDKNPFVIEALKEYNHLLGHENVEIKLGDITEMNLDEKSLDHVQLKGVLPSMSTNKLQETLIKIHTALKDDGTLHVIEGSRF